MPVTPTYPGVYIQEVDSGSRVVTGVATSITAFIGRTKQGPANSPMLIADFGEFQKLFGGRVRDLPMTYAVEDFFNNGGSQAVIVRVCAGPPSGGVATHELTTASGHKLKFTTALTGPVASQVYLDVAKGSKDGVYTIRFRLGSATSIVVLAELPDVVPGMLLMDLKTLASTVGVSYDGGTMTSADATALLDGLVGKPAQFTGDAAAGTPATFVAGGGADKLEIDALVPGSWADQLNLSIAPAGATGFKLFADHPAFENEFVFSFNAWGDLDTIKDTGILTAKTKPGKALKDWVGKGVPLTRVPDGTGAATAMQVYGPLVLTASSPGGWGNSVGVTFDKNKLDPHASDRFNDYDIDNTDDFWFVNVYYPLKKGQAPTPAERIGPVYLGPIDAPCRIDHMLAVQSDFLTARPPVAAPTADELPLDPDLLGKPDPSVTDGSARFIGVLYDGGDGLTMSSDIVIGALNNRTGLYALEQTDLFNILVVPPDPLFDDPDTAMQQIYQAAAPYCVQRRAILIADPPDAWGIAARKSQWDKIMPTAFAIDSIVDRRNVFTYFPRIVKPDPERNNRLEPFSASGMIAGVFAGTDLRRGVWKAPAGIEAGLNGVSSLEHKLTDPQNGQLNQVGVNVLRDFPIIGKVVWGSRTLAGADALSDDYKYLPVRRLTNYVEESLYRASKFAVFEPNSEPLWSSLRLMIGAFMADLARQGAFYDYFVRCDKTTTTQLDISKGVVNVIVGMAPVKPAEFVILTIQQLAGQTAA